MKTTIHQVMHAAKAAKTIMDYVHEQCEKLAVKDRAEMQSIISAAMTLENFVGQIAGAEVTIKA